MQSTTPLHDMFYKNLKGFAKLVNDQFRSDVLKTHLSEFIAALDRLAKVADKKEAKLADKQEESSANEAAQNAFVALMNEVKNDAKFQAISRFQNKEAITCAKNLRACNPEQESGFYMMYREAVLATYKKDNNAIAQLSTHSQVSTPAAIAQALFAITPAAHVEVKAAPPLLDTKMFDMVAGFRELLIERTLDGAANTDFITQLKPDWIRLINSFTEVKSEALDNGAQYLHRMITKAKKLTQPMLDYTDEAKAEGNPASAQAIKKGRDFVKFLTEQVTQDNFAHMYKVIQDGVLTVVRAHTHSEIISSAMINKVLSEEAGKITALIPNALKRDVAREALAIARILAERARQGGDGLGAQGGSARITNGDTRNQVDYDWTDPETYLDVGPNGNLKKAIKALRDEMYQNIRAGKLPTEQPLIDYRKSEYGEILMFPVASPLVYAIQFMISYELRTYLHTTQDILVSPTDQQIRDKITKLCLKIVREGLQANLLTREQAGPILTLYGLGYVDLDEVAQAAPAEQAGNASNEQMVRRPQ